MIDLGPLVRPGGRLACAGRPPVFGPTLAALALFALAALGTTLTGCVAGGNPLGQIVPGEPVRADTARVEAVHSALSEAANGEPRWLAAADALRRAGLTPIADAGRPGRERGFGFVALGARPLVAGFIPGRVPLHRDSLLIVRVALTPGDASAAVEAARQVAARSAYGVLPARTVLLVLDPQPAQPLDVLRVLPVWDRALVVGRLDLADRAAKGTALPSATPLARDLLDLSAPHAPSQTLAHGDTD